MDLHRKIQHAMRMTHEERAQRRVKVLYDLSQGMNTKEVAAKYDLRPQYVQEIAHKNKLRLGHAQLWPKTYELIAKLILTDWTLGVIAKEYGITKQRVSQIYAECKKAGIPVQERS